MELDSASRITYVGDDPEFLAELNEQLGGVDISQVDLESLDGEDLAGDWDRLLILDFAVSEGRGFEAFEQVRKRNAGMPVVLLASLDQRPLTQLGLARLGAAEGVFFKPIDDFGMLIGAIQRGFARLATWRAALQREQEFAAASPRG